MTDGSYTPNERRFYYQSFHYGVFLSVIYATAEKSTDNVIVAQAVIGAAPVWMVAYCLQQLRIAMRLF